MRRFEAPGRGVVYARGGAEDASGEGWAAMEGAGRGGGEEVGSLTGNAIVL